MVVAPTVVCVDELDRCRPDYAIGFLETTKHIFEVEGVIFLLAVNFSELANSVSALYGTEFDAQQYLRRFVDHVLHLQTDRSSYLEHLIKSTGFDRRRNQPYVAVSDYLETFILKVPDMSLRDLEQAIHHLGLVLNSLHRNLWGLYTWVDTSWLTALSHPSGTLLNMPLVRTLRFPAKCSPGAHRRLSEVFSMCVVLYNAALESWRGTYAWWREHHPGEPLPPELRSSKYDLMKEFTGVRSDLPEWERLAV